MCLFVFACSSQTDTTDGDLTDGDTSEGDMSEDDATDGDLIDGDISDGDLSDGDLTDGESTDGDSVDDESGEDEVTKEETPLARQITTLSHVDEAAWLLPGVSADKLGQIQDDLGSDDPGAEIGQIVDKLMTDQTNGRLVEIQIGDVDADGKDEIVVLSIYTDREESDYRFDYIRITIIDDKDAGFAILGTIGKEMFAKDPLNASLDSFLLADIALCNLDDDEAKEIVVTGSYGRIAAEHSGNNTKQYASVIYTFDDANNSFASLTLKKDTGSGTINMHVACGDLDNDNRDEIVVTGVDNSWAKAWALDDHTQGYEQLYRWHDLDNNIFREYIHNPNVLCGDFDGDGVDEVAFAASWNQQCKLQIRVYDDVSHDFAYMEGKYFEDCPNKTWNNYVAPKLAAIDINNNGKDDIIVAMHDNYSGQDRGWSIRWFRVDEDDSGYIAYHLAQTNENLNMETAFQKAPGGFSLSVGDFNRDRLPDVLAIYQRTKVINVIGYEGEKRVIEGFDAKRWSIGDDGFEEKESFSWDFAEALDYPNMIQPLVALGDFDGDSMIVRYTGEHWLAMSEPRIVVAMAMPPGWSSIPQDNKANTWVGYGQVRSEATSESNEISMSAAVTLSVEGGDPFGIVEASASATLKQELSKTKTQTKTISTGIKRVGSWVPEDLQNFVIYTATEYDRYKYEIITHEDADKIGTFLTVDVPKETNTYKKTVTAFNEQNGEFRDIGDETFSHTIGDPLSYPNKSDRDQILSDFEGWMTPGAGDPLFTIGETSGGGTEVFISMSDENASAESRTLGVEVSAGFAVGGVGVETTVGLSSTNVYEIAIAESTEYAGSIGDIPSDNYAESSYTFGMFVYNFTRDDGVKYQVINWCVKE